MPFPYSSVAVTGASGMVGRQLLRLLSARGVMVEAASRRRPTEIPNEVAWQPWDLTQWQGGEGLDAIFPNAEAVIHAGATIPGHAADIGDRALIDANVRACLDLGLWARKRGMPVVFISSSTVYASPDREGIKEGDPVGVNQIGGTYGLSKRLAEEIFRDLSSDGLSVCILRPSSVYGPGMPPDKMMIRFLKAAYATRRIALTSPTEDRHNLIHSSDLAAACLLALTHSSRGTFNVGGKSVTVREIAEACLAAVGGGETELPRNEDRKQPTVRFGLDCTAANDAFGFFPEKALENGTAELWQEIQMNYASVAS